MQSEKFEELYHYLKSRNDFEFIYSNLNIVEVKFNAENTFDILFNITETNNIFYIVYEVHFANIMYHKTFTGSLDESKDEINKITNKAMTLAETLKSVVKDTFWGIEWVRK